MTTEWPQRQKSLYIHFNTVYQTLVGLLFVSVHSLLIFSACLCWAAEPLFWSSLILAMDFHDIHGPRRMNIDDLMCPPVQSRGSYVCLATIGWFAIIFHIYSWSQRMDITTFCLSAGQNTSSTWFEAIIWIQAFIWGTHSYYKMQHLSLRIRIRITGFSH